VKSFYLFFVLVSSIFAYDFASVNKSGGASQPPQVNFFSYAYNNNFSTNDSWHVLLTTPYWTKTSGRDIEMSMSIPVRNDYDESWGGVYD